MQGRVLPFEYLEGQLRRKNFGIIGTITDSNRSHSTAVCYGVSPPSEKLAIYILTERQTRKTRNIVRKPEVSFVVPFPHRLLVFVPASCIQFQGKAEVLPLDDGVGRASFRGSRILRMVLDEADKDPENSVFIKIIPDKRIFGYGLGLRLLELTRDIRKGPFSSIVPNERL